MTRGQIFETTDLDLASFLVASSGSMPSVLRDVRTGLAAFHFTRDSAIDSLIVAYSGAAFANVRRLLAARRRLFHEVRRVQREVEPS